MIRVWHADAHLIVDQVGVELAVELDLALRCALENFAGTILFGVTMGSKANLEYNSMHKHQDALAATFRISNGHLIVSPAYGTSFPRLTSTSPRKISFPFSVRGLTSLLIGHGFSDVRRAEARGRGVLQGVPQSTAKG
jgi:hypothetical protein